MKTVNFLEAINSGRRFRILGGGAWWDKCTEYSTIALKFKQFNGEFELEEKTIEITESQFDEIWARGIFFTSKKSKLKKELGF